MWRHLVGLEVADEVPADIGGHKRRLLLYFLRAGRQTLNRGTSAFILCRPKNTSSPYRHSLDRTYLHVVLAKDALSGIVCSLQGFHLPRLQRHERHLHSTPTKVGSSLTLPTARYRSVNGPHRTGFVLLTATRRTCRAKPRSGASQRGEGQHSNERHALLRAPVSGEQLFGQQRRSFVRHP